MSPEPYSSRITGLAWFAVAIFAVGIVSIAGLDRVGAPERLIRALGPILALIAIAVFGIGARTATLALFIAAGRRSPPMFTAFSVVAIAAGAALGFGVRFVAPAEPIWFGAMVGVGFGAAALGPLVRRFGGASLSDVIATRFPNPLLRIASGLIVGAAAGLVGLAGYLTAVAIAEAMITGSRPWAETIVGAALLASVAAGGLTSLVWCSAATGAGAGLIALIGWILSSEAATTPIAALGGTASLLTALASPEELAAIRRSSDRRGGSDRCCAADGRLSRRDRGGKVRARRNPFVRRACGAGFFRGAYVRGRQRFSRSEPARRIADWRGDPRRGAGARRPRRPGRLTRIRNSPRSPGPTFSYACQRTACAHANCPGGGRYRLRLSRQGRPGLACDRFDWRDGAHARGDCANRRARGDRTRRISCCGGGNVDGGGGRRRSPFRGEWRSRKGGTPHRRACCRRGGLRRRIALCAGCAPSRPGPKSGPV